MIFGKNEFTYAENSCMESPYIDLHIARAQVWIYVIVYIV